MRYALVDASDVVVNVIELEPGTDYRAPDGCTLVQGRDWPPAPAPAAPPLADIKTALKLTVDDAAETERLKYLTGGSGQALCYEAKRTEAARWHTAGEPATPDADLYPWAAERATRLSVAIGSVLGEWMAQANAWAVIGRRIEGVREGAKEAIDAAQDETAARAIMASLTWPA